MQKSGNYFQRPQYPEGGGTVGVANEAYNGDAANQTPAKQDTSGFSTLGKGLMKYGKGAGWFGAPAAEGSAPIGAAAGQQSITALSSAPTVMAGTPATASLGGGAAGGGSSLMAAGPWAALAAAIIANETYQTKHGNRASGSQAEKLSDMLSGKDLERDVDKYAGHVPGAQWTARWGNPGGAWRNLKDLGGKIKGIF